MPMVYLPDSAAQQVFKFLKRFSSVSPVHIYVFDKFVFLIFQPARPGIFRNDISRLLLIMQNGPGSLHSGMRENRFPGYVEPNASISG